MLRGIGWYLITDVSGQPLLPIYYRVKKTECFPNVYYHSLLEGTKLNSVMLLSPDSFTFQPCCHFLLLESEFTALRCGTVSTLSCDLSELNELWLGNLLRMYQIRNETYWDCISFEMWLTETAQALIVTRLRLRSSVIYRQCIDVKCDLMRLHECLR